MKRQFVSLAGLAGLLIAAIAVLILVTDGGSSPAAANQTGPAEVSLGVMAGPNVSCDLPEKPLQCSVGLGAQFTLTANINALPPEGFSGFELDVEHTGLISKDVRYVVPDFEIFPVVGVGTESFSAGAVTALAPPILKSTYLGPLVEADLTCTTNPGTFEIALPVPRTNVLDQFAISIPINTVQHGDDKAADTLTISCAELGMPTSTPVQPTDTPVEPTNTPDMKICGDVNMDGAVNPLDALLILQLNADMIDSLENESNADVNNDGTVTSVDAALILQAVAGLISEEALDCS